MIEILSQRTATLAKESKRKVYAREGVEELWLLDTALKTVSLYSLQEQPDKPIAVYGIKDRFETAYFSGLKLQVKDIFRE